MTDFFETLSADYGTFLRLAVCASVLAAPACGVMGSLVVVRKCSTLSGALAHCLLAGFGLGVLLQSGLGLSWMTPWAGAFAVGLLAAFSLAWTLSGGWEREDTWISFLWAGGMAVGLLFFSFASASADPVSYLFGNILLIRGGDIWMLLGLNAIILALLLVFHRPLIAVCFDEEHARSIRLPVFAYHFLLMSLVCLTICLLVQMLGVVLVIAILTLPAAAAGKWCRRLIPMMIGAALISLGCLLSGLLLSYQLAWPTGPLIVLIAGSVYLASSGFSRIHAR